ncbi:MAG: hypothetical protein HFJ29_05995 [Clostridia bacterium]|nr:hypothetical protein [Clostridia bacterium]
MKKHLQKKCIKGQLVGSISEIYDSTKPYEAKGCFAQGWSVAEIFRIIVNYHKDD